MTPKKLRLLVSACVCALLAFCPGRLAAQNTIHVPADQPTIQAGIDAANPGDTVLVAPGTYNENIDFKGKAITVTSSGGPAVTTLDGGDLGSTVTMMSGEPRTAVLSGLTITNGGLKDPSTNAQDGPGIFIAYSAPTILNNVITKNYCQNISAVQAAPLIQGNVVSSSLNADTCSVTSTGGIHLEGSYSGPIAGVLSPIIMGNTIENNTTGEVGDGGGDGGAGIWDDGGSNLVVAGNIIRNNTTHAGNGGAILVFNAGPVAIVNNLIYGNSAGCGGAVAVEAVGLAAPYNVLIANNTIADNTAGPSGGYSNCSTVAQLYPNPYAYGSASPATAIINNVISGSTPYPAVTCSLLGIPSESDQPTFQNNILYNAGGPFFSSNCVDVSGKYDNIVADPQFVSPSTGDYTLKSTSPAIDSGQNSVLQTLLTISGVSLSTDLAGNPRVQDATGKGCIIDMGAYEYPGANIACGTTESLQSSLNPSTFGQTVTLTAQLSSANGVPTGNVQFSDGGTILATEAVSPGGVATFSTGQLAVGTHTLTAVFQPTGSFASATASLSQVVDGLPTTVSIDPVPASASAGQSVILTTTITPVNSPGPAPVTGSVTYFIGSTILGTAAAANGIASFSIATLPAGLDTITCTYNGSSIYAPSNCLPAAVFIVGSPTATTLTASPNPAYAGQPVTLVANVTAAQPPTGAVTFLDGATTLGTGTLNNAGQATFTTSSLAVGTHTLTATYTSVGSLFVSVSAPVTQTILASGFAIALSPSTLTMQAGGTGTVAIALTSIGNFSGPLTLTYGTLPSYTGATLAPPSVTLTAGGNGSASLLLNTAFAANTTPARPGAKPWPLVFSALLLLPFTLTRSRRLRPILGLLLALSALGALTGCTTVREPYELAPAGTYQVPITATDASGNQRTATLTVVVTPQ